MRQMYAWLMVEVYIMEEWRSVWEGSGARCVMTSGTIEKLWWCVDNLVIMEVSLCNHVRCVILFVDSLVTHNFTVAYALHEYGGHLDTINFHLDDVSCIGNETKLVDCFHSGVGNHNCRPGRDEAAVVCTGE